MSMTGAIEARCLYESAINALRGSGSAPRGDSVTPLWRRRGVVDGVAAMALGALVAIGCSVAVAGDGASARQARFERELAQLSPSLTEFARLARADESARARVAVAAARARPNVELRTLLETLSREAQAGVTVSRLRQTQEGFELQVHAVDSAACAAWVKRLARIPGWEAADIADLTLAAARIGGQGGRAMQARVRLPLRTAAPVPMPWRTPEGRERRSGGSGR